MTHVVVVRHNKSNKIVEFKFKEPFSEIEIVSSGVLNPDDYVVSLVDTRHVDWDTGYVVEGEAVG